MRSAATVAAWMDAIVLSRLTTTPLRRPSDGLSPTPRIATGVPGSSDSAMTTATRDVPRSRPTVLFRLGKTVLERLLERRDAGSRAGCRDYIGCQAAAGPDFVSKSDPASRACGSARLDRRQDLRARLLCRVDPLDVGLDVLGERPEALQPLQDLFPVVGVETADGRRQTLLHAHPVVLELVDRSPDARRNVVLIVLHRLGQVEHRLVESHERVLARRREAGGAVLVHGGDRLVRLHQRRPKVHVEEAVRALVVRDGR